MQPDRAHAAAQCRSAAAEDLRVARLLQTESPSTAAFHAQQAAEKGLNAVAIAVADDLPRTHVPGDLADEVAREGHEAGPAVRSHLRVLERLYAPTRYPDALDAVRRAEEVLAFVDGTIAKAFPR
ncbi:MAG: hypothetical protein NVS2B3_16800 [Vulcanimicrobiaceae bacterium]